MNDKKSTNPPPPSTYHEGGNATVPYPASRLAPAYSLVDMAREISLADQQIENRTHAKLDVIAEQIRSLQQQARVILEQARQDQLLHQAKCNFIRKPGTTYHLYEKDNGERYFSMLSPGEWGGSPPHRFLGSYRLENDMSWSDIEKEEPNTRDALTDYLLSLGPNN